MMVLRTAALCLLLAASTAVAAPPPAPILFHVSLSPAATTVASGRLLVFARPWGVADPVPAAVDTNAFRPAAVFVAAEEVESLAPGAAHWVNGDNLAFPAPFSSLKPGAYAVQAVLDVRHSYSYGGRTAEDPVSAVTRIEIGETATAPIDLVLLPVAEPAAAALSADTPGVAPLDFTSPLLSAFSGRDTHIRGWVATPPGYDGSDRKTRYPVVYWTHGFGGNLKNIRTTALRFRKGMETGAAPPMVFVVLDESLSTGTHEFADSANNGPWGAALTTELIPELERRYSLDRGASGRFLTGHSSGGWATLWLQTRYPKMFGGTWSTSPDPSDFHDFTGVDIYAPDASVYEAADGTARPLVRDHDRVLVSLKTFARLEHVLGTYGGQMSSFDWVFSPRAPDGRPAPMFDRATGKVDPAVVAYWREHYDIAWRLARDWKVLKPDLDGKIHVFVGAADTFYLDGAAHRLQAVLDGLGAHSEFRFIPDRTHGDLYRIGADPRGLETEILWAMYRKARPGTKLSPK